MNHAPVTLILIASFGLVAVLGLGLFFALKPRTKVTTTWFDFSERAKNSARSIETSSTGGISPVIATSEWLPVTTTTALRSLELGTWYTPSEKVFRPTTVTATTTTTTGLVTQSTLRHKFEQEEPPVEEVIDLQRIDVELQPPSEAEIESMEEEHGAKTRPETESRFLASKNHSIRWVSETKLAGQGKIVGLAFQNSHIFASSTKTGNITVLSTPSLKIVDSVPCPKCYAYDVAVFSNGDMVVAQGKERKLTKISRTKRIVRELELSYATKGLAVSPNKSPRRFVYVLARTHDKIYKYDRHLNPAGMIQIPNQAQDDCNFLAVGKKDRLYVSCENSVFVIGSRGNLVGRLKPQRGSYSVGIAVDANDNILVARRGKSQIDIFDKTGRYRKTLGGDKNTLWSDLAVGGNYAYIVDYMGITVKAMKY